MEAKKLIIMHKIKFKKIYLIGLLQLIFEISFFIWGIYFKSNSNIISSNFLEVLTKVQTTNDLQNFIWCFTNNLVVLFIIFWLSYWTFGIIGTLWCANSSFMLGSIIKLSIGIGSWISVIFILLELSASIIMILFSTYFRFEKSKFKKFCKKNYINMNDEICKTVKKKREKNILIILSLIATILLIAAILETFALSLIK